MVKSTKSKAAKGALRLRRLGIDTYRENVVYLHRECEVYRTEGFQALSKVKVCSDGQHILAVLNVVDDENIVMSGDLGLSEEAFIRLGLDEDSMVRIEHAEPPASMDAVRRKIAGERLSQQDFHNIIRDITDTRYSKTEISAFLVASGQTDMDRDEVFYLTRAMLDSGEKLDWNESLVADKHCIGGIPGNRTSMLVVPIVAAHGMLIPKTSSRAITSPAGTADTMEVLANVELDIKKLHDIVRKTRACLAWGGTAELSPADDIMIAVERPLGIDSLGQMVASILSKKLAAGSTHLLIDIPVGPTAKVRQMRQAQRLRKLFEFVADQLAIHLEVVITDGRQPVGCGIGPVLECRDIMQVLQNTPDAPADLRQKSLRLAGRVLEFDPDVRGGQGYSIARDIVDSGRALEMMNTIIKAQGEQSRKFELGSLTHEVLAPADGVVVNIDNLQMANIARFAGAPIDKGAGVDLFKKLGDKVEKGEALYRIHAMFPSDFKFAIALCDRDSGYSVGDESQIPKAFVEF
ncbi:MAG: thymidine phosphorylase family protein [Gammaproteobacteria bacterium]|nr:thymidine phosphorylase family protein [Gammaproteobacteria bacterium]NNJ50050.1 thymidine phosphorylase family protein [Gammaproteobacteria bacterium]